MEKIDIGSLPPPRARTIYLEPIPKRSRKKRPATAAQKAATSDMPGPGQSPETDSTRAHETAVESSAVSAPGEDSNHDATVNPRSPIHSDILSEISGDSAVSTSTSTGPSGSAERSQKRDSGSQPTGSTRKSGVEDRTITATIELLKGGCLPGDMVSVKISVQHIKRIKSMHGVIVTLYRQGRIDSAPPISLFKGHVSEEEARRLQKEEYYYPKSKTGLGGLSLSSAGPCSVFRKDLSQSFTPLIIDPVTLTASVTTSVRIPADAFPTIKGVPGEMITFKYQLEVIVDLGGKLASQIQSGQSSTGRVGAVVPSPGPPLVGNPYEGGAASLASWGGRPIDTDRLRREKGVISVAFEVVVGTDDSSRQRGKMRASPSIHTQQYQEQPSPYAATGNEKGILHDAYDNEAYQEESYGHDYTSFPPTDPNRHPSYDSPEPPEAPAPFYVPPPQIPNESEQSEKERIKQAEQRLLPSQPDPAPSNPSYLDGENIYDIDDDEPQAGPSSQNPPPLPPHQTEAGAGPSAPTLDELAAAGAGSPDDDKQELERRRLMAEASAPPEFPEDCDAAGPSGSAPPPPPASLEPSAPVLGDEEHYGPQHAYQEPGAEIHGQGSGRREELPRYER